MDGSARTTALWGNQFATHLAMSIGKGALTQFTRYKACDGRTPSDFLLRQPWGPRTENWRNRKKDWMIQYEWNPTISSRRCACSHSTATIQRLWDNAIFLVDPYRGRAHSTQSTRSTVCIGFRPLHSDRRSNREDIIVRLFAKELDSTYHIW